MTVAQRNIEEQNKNACSIHWLAVVYDEMKWSLLWDQELCI